MKNKKVTFSIWVFEDSYASRETLSLKHLEELCNIAFTMRREKNGKKVI